MITKKEIKRRYIKLLEDVKTKDFYTKVDLSNRVNCYVCERGHVTKTKDIDAGVTPFMFTCEVCGENATSTFFKDIAPEQKPTYEWFRPTLEKTLKMTKRKSNEGMIEHILLGGLDYRKC